MSGQIDIIEERGGFTLRHTDGEYASVWDGRAHDPVVYETREVAEAARANHPLLRASEAPE